MSPIPERGYGSWAEWERRWQKNGDCHFKIDGLKYASQETEEWADRHCSALSVPGKAADVARQEARR